jgi:hypothetical protein
MLAGGLDVPVAFAFAWLLMFAPGLVLDGAYGA